MPVDPLAEADQLPNNPDRRENQRAEIFSDLRGEVMVYKAMTVRQISHTGVLVETTYPLQIDSLHEIRLSLGATSVVVKSRVVHCAVTGMDSQCVSYRAGLEFVEPGPAVRLAIEQFIDLLKSAEWRADPPPGLP